ncbi:aminopeptidase N C-terminal domain-containing protein, partial [Mycobacterium tuberculosis]|nr:aminopeptidase N C-terminal domain-containing protein [Mycobacterium tuberculosis]
ATQYHQADNMTDALAALSAAVAAELPCRDALMQEYDDKWHQDGLVMDKWFILQSTSPAANVVETVRGLLNHRSFSTGKPNRCAAVAGYPRLNRGQSSSLQLTAPDRPWP